MSETIHKFGRNAVALPYSLDARLADWESLRREMVRGVAPAFTRDEWAYMVAFLDPLHLRETFTRTFGPEADAGIQSLWRPRGGIAIWLPNNVSLLGPLVLILASFTGQPIRVKTGSRSDELCGSFVEYCLAKRPPNGLKEYLASQITIQAFDRNDSRNAEMAAYASVRIAFGSDQAVAAVHAMSHPVESVGISFGNKRSEAWVRSKSLDDAQVDILLKVFAIYGQAGCTSPRRVILLDGSRNQALELRERMLQRWPLAIKRKPAMHVASSNIMSAQWNSALGWDCKRVSENSAVIGVGSLERGEMNGIMALPITWASIPEAIEQLPGNIQTVGHLADDPEDLLAALVSARVKRFVPLSQMHHFGPVWDGINFWANLFEEVQVVL
jgi:hypothetical protein